MSAPPAEAPHALVELLAETWESLLDLLAGLDDDEWALPTDCPGWSVQDVVAHVVGVEAMLTGRPAPDVGEHEWPHVRSDMGRALEAWVESYRGRPPSEVLEDLRDTVESRLAFWRGLDAAGWATETFTPVGPGTMASLIPFRLFDSWVHEHDVRWAVGAPPRYDTAAGRWNLRRCSQPLARAVARVAAAPDGSVVEWLAHGPPFDHRHAVLVRDGRGEVIAALGTATVRIVTDLPTFVRLGCGRVDPDAALAARLVRLRGDADLGTRVVHAMPFTP